MVRLIKKVKKEARRRFDDSDEFRDKQGSLDFGDYQSAFPKYTEHQWKLIDILKFYSTQPNSDTAWKEEWYIDPNYMVDLGQYGAGHCMCGHRIRYQFRFVNERNQKSLPVGSVCVEQLDVAPYNEVIERLSILKGLSEIKNEDSLDGFRFYEKYKDMVKPKMIESINNFYHIFSPEEVRSYTNLRKNIRGKYEAFRSLVLSFRDKAKVFIDRVEANSQNIKFIPIKPVNPKDNTPSTQMSFNF